MKRAIFFGAIFAVIALSAGCKPKVGKPCKPGKDVCTDPKTALRCSDAENKYVEVKCGGLLGCRKLGTLPLTCDQSTAEEGDTCISSEGEDHACSKDKKKELVCKDNKFQTHMNCRGADGCVMAIFGKRVDKCDQSVAEKGDSCPNPEKLACSPDSKQMYMCSPDKKWEVYRYCRGDGACQVKFGAANCDLSKAELNDPCNQVGTVACTPDGTKELICKAGRYTASRDCAKEGCHVTQKGLQKFISCR